MRRATVLLPILVIALVGILSSIFIVDEREKALVLQFGQIKRVKEDPGLAFKIPLIQNVARYDDRILSLDTDPIEVTPSDDRRLVVDAFARYRIADVVDFREAVGAGGILDAERRLGNILDAQIRAVLGSEGVTSNTILSDERTSLMNRIRDEARERALAIGLDVIDVRLKQTNLPEQNLDATFARMRAEREREAADEIARGEEAAQRVRALADRTVVELESEARRESEITRGEADAQRNAIYAEAFGADPEFFEFYRSLAAYQQALQEGNSTMVMSPDSEFFDYLRNVNPRGVPMPDAAVAPAEAAPEAGEETPEDGAALDAAPGGAAPGGAPGGAATEVASTPPGDGATATD
jgi:modulator of FtsH protease HflC